MRRNAQNLPHKSVRLAESPTRFSPGLIRCRRGCNSCRGDPAHGHAESPRLFSRENFRRAFVGGNPPPSHRSHARCLGAAADQIQLKLPIDASNFVVNSNWQQGQLSSIHTAIRSLPERATEGLLLCPVDHPLISSQLVARLIEEFDSSGKDKSSRRYFTVTAAIL